MPLVDCQNWELVFVSLHTQTLSPMLANHKTTTQLAGCQLRCRTKAEREEGRMKTAGSCAKGFAGPESVRLGLPEARGEVDLWRWEGWQP